MTQDPKIDVSFEDKVWHFWNRYKKHTLLLITFIILFMAGIQGVKFFQANSLREFQEAYQDAEDAGKRLEFAKAHPLENLSGTVFLQFADKAFNQADYSTALEHYQAAEKALKGSTLLSRAQLGTALTRYMSGEVDIAMKALEDLSQNASSLSTMRAEAAYHYAIIALDRKEFQKSEDAIQSILNLRDSGIWGQKAVALMTTTPELAR